MEDVLKPEQPAMAEKRMTVNSIKGNCILSSGTFKSITTHFYCHLSQSSSSLSSFKVLHQGGVTAAGAESLLLAEVVGEKQRAPVCGIDRKGMEGLSTRITSVVTEGGNSESCSECKGLQGKNPFMFFR